MIKPSIEVAAKFSDVMGVGVTPDCLIGNARHIKLHTKMLQRMENTETLPYEEKSIIYKMIDRAISLAAG